jgi:hypothetical protein
MKYILEEGSSRIRRIQIKMQQKSFLRFARCLPDLSKWDSFGKSLRQLTTARLKNDYRESR